jgi:hypothetical protein
MRNLYSFGHKFLMKIVFFAYMPIEQFLMFQVSKGLETLKSYPYEYKVVMSYTVLHVIFM